VATERGCWECEETLSTLQNMAHVSSSKPPLDDDRQQTKPSIDL